MSLYESLGVRRIVNAQGRYTSLGGSLMAPQVTAAMAEAARSYVDMYELQERAGARLAELTRNDAAYVCNGATAGLFLATLACMTRGDELAIARLPRLDGLPTRVIMHRTHRMPLDVGILLTGVEIVEVGNILQTTETQLEAALASGPACVVYLAGTFYEQGALSLERTVEMAHAHGVAVVVDAAEQVPPVENFWRYTREQGADLALFSGGKGLCGPQSSGLIVGDEQLVRACSLLGFPHTNAGRPMKVGKEEIAGLLAAVELSVERDRDEWKEGIERVVSSLLDEVGSEWPGVSIERDYPAWSHDVPRIRISFADPDVSAASVRRRLLEGEPAVAVEIPPNTNVIFVTPDTLEPGEERIVAARLREVLGSLDGRGAPPVR